MYRLSCWAQRNKWQARVVIGFANSLLFLMAWIGGGVLAMQGYALSPLWMWVILILGISAMAIYPRTREQKKAASYVYRKSLDALLTFCSCAILLGISNQSAQQTTPSYIPYSSNPVYAAVHEPPVKPGIKKQKQLLRKWMRSVKAQLTQGSRTQNTGRVIVAVLIALVLAALIAGLSCSLACNGAGFAAGALLLLGLSGIIFLCRAIIRGGKRPKKETPETRATPPSTGAL